MYTKKYGLNQEQFDAMLLTQNYQCAICSITLKGSKWVIDHDHRVPLTKDLKHHAVRGILCNNCNVGLGRFSDDINTVENALIYLLAHNRRLIDEAKNNKRLKRHVA